MLPSNPSYKYINWIMPLLCFNSIQQLFIEYFLCAGYCCMRWEFCHWTKYTKFLKVWSLHSVFFIVPPISKIHMLNALHVTVLEPLRMWLRLNEVVRVESWSNRTGVLTRGGTDSKVPSLACNSTVGRWSSALQEESSHQNLTMLVPWSQTFSLQSCEKINFCCISHSVCGILLWQLVLTNTALTAICKYTSSLRALSSLSVHRSIEIQDKHLSWNCSITNIFPPLLCDFFMRL